MDTRSDLKERLLETELASIVPKTQNEEISAPISSEVKLDPTITTQKLIGTIDKLRNAIRETHTPSAFSQLMFWKSVATQRKDALENVREIYTEYNLALTDFYKLDPGQVRPILYNQAEFFINELKRDITSLARILEKTSEASDANSLKLSITSRSI